MEDVLQMDKTFRLLTLKRGDNLKGSVHGSKDTIKTDPGEIGCEALG
jgi:hypothetical protein